MPTTVHLPRMTWEQADICAQVVDKYFESETHFIGGSWRRHCKSVGDIDIALLRSPTLNDTLRNVRQGFLAEKLLDGSQQQRYICHIEGDIRFKLDVWIINSIAGWGPTCCFVAGDGMWNTMQRQVAKTKGYTLGFYLKRGSDIIPAETEKDVYQLLNIPWRDYPARSLMQK